MEPAADAEAPEIGTTTSAQNMLTLRRLQSCKTRKKVLTPQ